MSQQESGKAVASLVFGILGLLGICPIIGSILAIVLGQGEPGGCGKAGVILGWIGIALSVLGVVVFVIFAVFAGGVAAVQGG